MKENQPRRSPTSRVITIHLDRSSPREAEAIKAYDRIQNANLSRPFKASIIRDEVVAAILRAEQTAITSVEQAAIIRARQAVITRARQTAITNVEQAADSIWQSEPVSAPVQDNPPAALIAPAPAKDPKASSLAELITELELPASFLAELPARLLAELVTKLLAERSGSAC